MLTNMTLNVLNKPLHASALTIIQIFVLYIPLAYAGSYLLEIPGIFGAAATANIIAGLTAYLWLKRVFGIMRADSTIDTARELPMAEPAREAVVSGQ